MKILVTLFIFLQILYANSNFALQLSSQFKEDVIELNIYKKHYKSYIAKECKSNKNTCIKQRVNSLKRWQSSKVKILLEKKLQYRLNQISINEQYWLGVQDKIEETIKQKNINTSEYLTLIDISRQLFIVTLYEKKYNRISFIGADLISTGNIEKEKEIKYGQDHYFRTPSGIYENSLGWRSNGKINEDGITKAYGENGRFVYYFGKHKSKRYNTFDSRGNKVYNKEKWKLISGYLNFAMHAYDSPMQLGVPQSHGCVRMSSELNLFLDKNRILHQNRLESHLLRGKYSRNEFMNSFNVYSGKILVIVDSVI